MDESRAESNANKEDQSDCQDRRSNQLQSTDTELNDQISQCESLEASSLSSSPSQLGGQSIHGSSSGRSSRNNQQPRVIELIQAQVTNGSAHNWTIGAEFYDEDIAQEMSSNADDDEDEDDDLNVDHDVVMRGSSDDTDDDLDREGDFDEHDDDDHHHLHHQDSSEDSDDIGDQDNNQDEEEGYEVVDPAEVNPDLPYLEYRHPMRVVNRNNNHMHPDLDLMVHGFVYAGDDETTSDESTSSEVAANYDTALPASHRYLGENLEESRGRQVLLEGTSLALPLISIRDVVLFPGQTLPLSASNLQYRVQRLLKSSILGRSKTIGFMWDPRKGKVGTTAELRNYSTSHDGDDNFSVIMEGRQRFKLLSASFETAIEGKIEILPEITLGPPYPRLGNLQRFQNSPKLAPRCIISKHPYWLLRRYEAHYIVAQIVSHLKDWSNIASLNQDPKDLSYWIASSLPISNHERMRALSFDTTEARLLWLLNLLNNCTYFGCVACKNVICHKADVFPMSQSGPQCSFVNPGGFIHDTLTVIKATGLIQDHGPLSWSTEYTWFPGYAWRTAHCNLCNRHIGWCYKSEDSETKPRKFFGLSRQSVRLQYREPLDLDASRFDLPEAMISVEYRRRNLRRQNQAREED